MKGILITTLIGLCIIGGVFFVIQGGELKDSPKTSTHSKVDILDTQSVKTKTPNNVSDKKLAENVQKSTQDTKQIKLKPIAQPNTPVPASKVNKSKPKTEIKKQARKRRKSTVKGVRLSQVTSGMFFLPGSSIKFRGTASPKSFNSKIKYLVSPRSGGKFSGNTLKLTKRSFNKVSVKACVENKCSRRITLRELEEAPE